MTEEWRSTWNPQDQNCWQSKCHATNHPPDGFFLPYSPPVVGAIIPAMFETAYDLYLYNHEEMPWHNVHSMTEKESWAVTAYVLELNGLDPGVRLNEETAAQIRLRPAETDLVERIASEDALKDQSLSVPVDDSVSVPQKAGWMWLLGGGIGAAVFAILVVIVLLRRKNNRLQ